MSRSGTRMNAFIRRGSMTKRKDPFGVQPDTEVWKWISRLVASGSACYGVGHGYRAVPNRSPTDGGERMNVRACERASEDEDALARAWLVWGRCGSFTGNRVSHAPFFVTKRKAAVGWRTLSKICLVLRRPPELLGYPVTVPRPTSVLQYTCRYSLAGHSHRANKCAADARRAAFLPAGRGMTRADRGRFNFFGKPSVAKIETPWFFKN